MYKYIHVTTSRHRVIAYILLSRVALKGILNKNLYDSVNQFLFLVFFCQYPNNKDFFL